MRAEKSKICIDFRNIAENTADMLRRISGSPYYSEVVGTNVTGDISRRVDIEAENYIVDEIRKLDYKAWIVSEERGTWKLHEEPDIVVLVDPLDGSLNYYLGIPFASVSIAVYKKNSRITEPFYGVVRSIFSNDVIEVCNGIVLLNNVPIKSNLNRGNDVISIYAEKAHQVSAIINKLREKSSSVKTRTMGSAALEAAYAALGLIGHFVHITGRIRTVDIPVGLAIAFILGKEVYTDPHVDTLELISVQTIRKVVITTKSSGLIEVVEQLEL